jgi:hypothetical protein
MGRPSWRVALLGLLSCLPSCLGVTISGSNGGVDPSTGQRPFRRELGEFEVSGAAFDLYIQALRQFQSQSQGNEVSWFGICGTASDAGSSHHKLFADAYGQVFMVDRTSLGMVSKVRSKLATARIAQ